MTNATGAELTARQQAISLAAVLSTAFGLGIAFGVGVPLTTLTFEGWDQPEWMIGLAGAAPSLGVLVMLPFVPRFIARLGLTRAIVGGYFAGAMGFFALYLFPSAWAWVAVRCLMSAGLALPWLGSETWINSVAGSNSRNRVIGLYVSVFFLGFAAGPPLLQAVGLDGIWPFLCGAVGVALSAVPLILARKLAPEFDHDETRGLVAAGRIAPVATAGGFIAGFSEMTSYALLPNVALASGLSQSTALYLLTMLLVGGIFLQFPLGWLTDRLPRSKVLLGVVATASVLLWLLPGLITLPVVPGIIAFLIGGAVLGFYASALAIIGDDVAPRDLAAANAAFLVMYQLGGIAGPVAAGVAMTWAPATGFVVTLTAAMLLFGAFVIAYGASERRRGAQMERSTTL
jgi:MFS family permease